ncbi:MAG: acyl carrier protein, partial [Deltaproteobacteria bacterium]|nr:acyl carrier protein [Deltaproteobacteria bacterium]
TDLVADLGLDSMAVMELLAAIEDRFDISIPLNILPDVRTLKDLALQIQQLMVEL